MMDQLFYKIKVALIIYLIVAVSGCNIALAQTISVSYFYNFLELCEDNSLSIFSLTTGANIIEYDSNGSSFVEMDEGMLCSTGDPFDAINLPDASTDLPFSPDSDSILNLLDTATALFDNSLFGIGIWPLGDTLEWTFIFASEEFFSLNPKNDMMGIFISGQNPNGGMYDEENIALIPGSNMPVTVENLLNPQNIALVDTTGDFVPPYDEPFAYNGYTQKFTAKIAVVPMSSYNLRIRIADGDDAFDDSAFFLEKGGLSCPSSTGAGSNVAVLALFQPMLCINDTIPVYIQSYATGYNPNGLSQVTWSNGSHQNDTLLPAGTYTVTATDINQYSDSTIYTFTIDNGTGPLVYLDASYDSLACFGDSTWVDFTVSGGTSPFNVPNDGFYPAGNYTFAVTDTNQCHDEIEINILQPTQLELISGYNDITCFGDSTLVNFDITGGPPPFLIPDNGYFTAGSYNFTIQDSNLCQEEVQLIITEPFEFELFANYTEIRCFGDSTFLNFSADGGIQPYTLPNDTFCFDGSYTFYAEDQNQCLDSIFIELTEPLPILLDYQTINASSISSSDGGIDLTVTGGTPAYNYQWSNGSTNEDIENLLQGTYFVTVFDSFGCETSDSIIVAWFISIENPSYLDHIRVYPNPVRDELIIEGLEGDEIVSINDVLGKQILLKIGKDLNPIDTSLYPEGIYILSIRRNTNIVTYKIIKQK